uniref:Uncharacterized protein n=1 Tax=Vespula pensylvanica TaxID=30213 RepID=A0A834JP65_VESPE|nr:hypothetical protein H0235_017457 [Vespula pensylvanica]
MSFYGPKSEVLKKVGWHIVSMKKYVKYHFLITPKQLRKKDAYQCSTDVIKFYGKIQKATVFPPWSHNYGRTRTDEAPGVKSRVNSDLNFIKKSILAIISNLKRYYELLERIENISDNYFRTSFEENAKSNCVKGRRRLRFSNLKVKKLGDLQIKLQLIRCGKNYQADLMGTPAIFSDIAENTNTSIDIYDMFDMTAQPFLQALYLLIFMLEIKLMIEKAHFSRKYRDLGFDIVFTQHG